MNGPEVAAVDNMVKRLQKGIDIQGRKDFHIEHFEIRPRTRAADATTTTAATRPTERARATMAKAMERLPARALPGERRVRRARSRQHLLRQQPERARRVPQHARRLAGRHADRRSRFTVLLDDPVVISGTGRVVHLQDEPRGMGVAFHGLSAEMTLRVIDAITWLPRPRGLAPPSRAFRTRELTAEELAQLEEEATRWPASRSRASAPHAVLSEDSLARGRSQRPRPPRPRGPLPASASRTPTQSLRPAALRRLAPVPAARKPPPPPPKDDDYEDF